MGAADDAVTCPAGRGIDHTLRGPACRCTILNETITREENSRTLVKYCAGDYTACNVWRAQRDADLANRGKALQREIEAATPKADRDAPVVVGGR